MYRVHALAERAATAWLLAWTVGCTSSGADLRTSTDAGPARDATVDGAARDAGAVDPAHDAGEGDAGPPPHHATCELGLSAVLPPEPTIARDARGRPLFDLWRDLACDDPSVTGFPLCSEYRGERGVACYACAPGSGLCQDVRAQVPTSTCVPTVGGEPRCTSCLTLEAKRKACCTGGDAFCRAWPFEGVAKSGEPCAAHADCEPGLVCTTPTPGFDKPDPPYGYGLCLCPDAPFPEAECSPARVP